MGLFDDITKGVKKGITDPFSREGTARIASVGLLDDKQFTKVTISGNEKDFKRNFSRPTTEPKPLTAAEKAKGKQRYKELTSQYDKKSKSYTVDGKRVKSAFTPEQGGYYADLDKEESPNAFYDKRSTYGVTEYYKGVLKSRALPYKRVNRSAITARNSIRKQKQQKFGRSATVLTNTLGGTSVERKRKTLLS